MNGRRLLAAVLLRCYPPRWRREYGDELRHILESRPATLAIVADVLASGLRQRARTASPSTILGVVSMLLVLSQFFVWPEAVGRYWPAAILPSGITFPTVRITLLSSELWVYVGIACGYWTEARWPSSPSRAGRAAMRMVLIGGSPVMMLGLLMATGLVAGSASGVAGRGFTPSPVALILAPIATMPIFWFWGHGGAWLKQWVNRRREARQQKLT
jgi:hypothetical protein